MALAVPPEPCVPTSVYVGEPAVIASSPRSEQLASGPPPPPAITAALVTHAHPERSEANVGSPLDENVADQLTHLRDRYSPPWAIVFDGRTWWASTRGSTLSGTTSAELERQLRGRLVIS